MKVIFLSAGHLINPSHREGDTCFFFLFLFDRRGRAETREITNFASCCDYEKRNKRVAAVSWLVETTLGDSGGGSPPLPLVVAAR